jgi:predicted transcriptional regulator
MSKQSLNRLHVFALVDKKSREAVTEVMKPESLRPGSSAMPTLLPAGRILSFAIMLALGGHLPFVLGGEKIQSSGFAYRLCRHATNLPLGQKYSYTTGMKTAVSIPEDVFKGAERLARKTKRSRSRLFSDALKEYLARHTPDSVTEAMNKACSGLGAAKDEFVSSAAGRVLERSEW